MFNPFFSGPQSRSDSPIPRNFGTPVVSSKSLHSWMTMVLTKHNSNFVTSSCQSGSCSFSSFLFFCWTNGIKCENFFQSSFGSNQNQTRINQSSLKIFISSRNSSLPKFVNGRCYKIGFNLLWSWKTGCPWVVSLGSNPSLILKRV